MAYDTDTTPTVTYTTDTDGDLHIHINDQDISTCVAADPAPTLRYDNEVNIWYLDVTLAVNTIDAHATATT
jgi:hypothetical protein